MSVSLRSIYLFNELPRRLGFGHLANCVSTAGISLKSQELFLLVFITRYLDIFTNFYSLYNTAMKIVYLGGVLHSITENDPP